MVTFRWASAAQSFFALAAMVFGVGCSSTISAEEFQRTLESSQNCQPGDTCFLAGASACSCAQPTNSKDEETVNQAAADIDCGGALVKCMSWENLRCEAGKCTGDRDVIMSEAKLLELIQDSQACEEGDTCVLAGDTQCSCPQPVSSKNKEQIDQAAGLLDCGGKTVKCQGYINPRCADKICVADRG